MTEELIQQAVKIVASGRLKSYSDDTIAADVVNLTKRELLDSLVAYAPDHASGWMEQMRRAFLAINTSTRKEADHA